MLISSKGRYALRVMIDLAEQNNGQFIPLKEIASRQEISEKYLESIISILTKAGFLIGLRGKGGGYKLTKQPHQYTVGSILKLTEDSLSPVSCLANKPIQCKRATECRTLSMWEKLDDIIDNFFESYTISDLMNNQSSFDNYVI